jgi:hypothetical protein
MTRGEMCEQLAQDYANRASILRLSFEDAFNKYIKRLSKRTDDDILQQFTIANLNNLPSKKSNRTEEYIITINDDDCEDGVCKL